MQNPERRQPDDILGMSKIFPELNTNVFAKSVGTLIAITLACIKRDQLLDVACRMAIPAGIQIFGKN